MSAKFAEVDIPLLRLITIFSLLIAPTSAPKALEKGF
jgi:hypothetical protein